MNNRSKADNTQTEFPTMSPCSTSSMNVIQEWKALGLSRTRIMTYNLVYIFSSFLLLRDPNSIFGESLYCIKKFGLCYCMLCGITFPSLMIYHVMWNKRINEQKSRSFVKWYVKIYFIDLWLQKNTPESVFRSFKQ